MIGDIPLIYLAVLVFSLLILGIVLTVLEFNAHINPKKSRRRYYSRNTRSNYKRRK